MNKKAILSYPRRCIRCTRLQLGRKYPDSSYRVQLTVNDALLTMEVYTGAAVSNISKEQLNNISLAQVVNGMTQNIHW